MDNRRENWTSEELTINNTTSAASIRHFSLPILQDFPPLSDFSVSNNSAALSSVTKNSQSHSVDVFTRPHFEGSHLTPGSTIPPQLPMDNTRESQTIDESTLNNMTYTFGLEDVPLLNDNSNASACLGSERSSTSLSRVYDSSQSPGMSILPSFDFRIRPRLTSGVNIPPQLPLEIGTESQTRETPTVNGITTSFGPVGVPLVHNSTASACLSSSSRGYNYSSSPGLCFLPQSHSRGSGLTSSVNIPPQFPMNDRRDIQTVEDSAVTNMTLIFGPGDLPLSKENSPGLAFVPQNSALTHLSEVTEYSQSPGMNFSLRSDFNSSPGMNIPSQLPIDYTGYAEGESIVNNMTGVYSSYFPLSQDIFTPSTSFEQFSSSASRNVHYSLSPSVPFLTGPDARSLQNTFGVNRSQQSPMDNGRESQTLGESSVNTSTVLSRPVNIPARPAVPLLRRVSAPRREFHPVLSNKFPWSRVGGGSNSGKRMQLIRPGFMNVDRNNQVPCSNIPAPRTPLVNSVQTHSNSATSSVPLGERKRRISPGCHIQDPKQPKVTSVDMAVKQGSPTDYELEELGNEIGEKWIKLGRRLGVKEPKLQDIEQRHNQLCERGYHMLMDWKQENGSAATYVTLNAALQHELVQRKDLGEKICYKNVSAVNSFDLKTCQRKLAEHYQRTAKIPTTVWSSICQVNLDKIYTPLSWVKREETGSGSSLKEMGHYTEMFAEKSGSGAPPKKRILVQGDTGIGKTTFVKKMLVDLSNLEEAKLDEEQKNALRRFDLVLAVDLKEVSQCKTFTEVLLGSRLFPRDDDKFFDDLNSYILKNQERVLLVFDGFDEYRTGSEAEEQYGSRSDSPVSQIFHRTILSDCTVMVITRSSRADELRGSADFQAEVTGFSELDRKDFMMKMLKSKTEVYNLHFFLWSKGMEDLVRVPLLNLFFCLLWREEKNELENGTKSKTNLYQAIVRSILRHSHRKHSPTQAFMVKVDNYEDILDEIGKVALEGLLRGGLVFEYGELSAAVRGEKSVLAGLLQLSEYGPSVEPKEMVSFIHKSIQEYLAAWYVTNRCVPEGNLGGMEEHARTLVRCQELEKVFHFICGLSDDGAVKILEHLKSVRISNPELDYSKTISDMEKETCESLPLITYNHDNFNHLVLCCFDEVQSKAKLLDLCLDCVGRVVLVDDRTIKFVQKWDVDIQLMHSEVKFRISVQFNEFMEDEDIVNYPRLLLEVFGGGGEVLQVTESGNPFTLRDFIVRYFEVVQCYCSFTSILSLHNGRFQFHIVELTLSCGHHTKLLTRTTASCAQSRSRDLSSAESCLDFLRDLRCYFCGESVQLFDEFCDLLQSVPNPNKCFLNLGRLEVDMQVNVECEHRLTTAEAEKLARALLPFTRIASVALNVSDCSAAAVETLVTGINRKTVEELRLHGITLTSAVAAALRRSLPEMSSLQELSLTEMNVSNLQAEEGSALFDVFLQMESFRCDHHFSLRGWPAPLSTIPQYILNLHLKICDINTDEGNLVCFFESLRFIPRLNHLEGLSLTCTGSSEQVDVDASSLSLIWKWLTLAGINLTPAVAAALSRSLANMSSLQFLKLAGKNKKDVVNMDAKVMEALVGGFEKVLPLTDLEFSGFSVRGCFAPLAKSFRFFPGLNELSLTRLNLDELDLNCLLENFEFIPLLKRLDLSRTPLGDAVRSILPYVINLSNLRVLSIEETSSDEHLNYVKEAIRQARPDITVCIKKHKFTFESKLNTSTT